MEALLIEAYSFRLFQKWYIFYKAKSYPEFNHGGTLKEWLVLRSKLNFSHTKIGGKVQPHQPSVLIVYPTQMLKYLRFNCDCGVCGNNRESTSKQHKLVILMIKFLEKVDYYVSLPRVAHCFFMCVEITFGVEEKQLV